MHPKTRPLLLEVWAVAAVSGEKGDINYLGLLTWSSCVNSAVIVHSIFRRFPPFEMHPNAYVYGDIALLLKEIRKISS